MIRPRSRTARSVQRSTAGDCLAYSGGTVACRCARPWSTCGDFSFGSCPDVVAGASVATRLKINAQVKPVRARRSLVGIPPPSRKGLTDVVHRDRLCPVESVLYAVRKDGGLDQKYGVQQKE